MIESSCCSISLSRLDVFSIWDFGHSNRCVLVSHCVLILNPLIIYDGFPDDTMVKNPPANAGDTRDMGSFSWGEEIFWSKKRQPTPVFFPWKIPWAEKSGGLQSMGSHIWTWLSMHLSSSSNNMWHWAHFHILIFHLCIFLDEVSVQIFCPHILIDLFFLLLSPKSSVYWLYYSTHFTSAISVTWSFNIFY